MKSVEKRTKIVAKSAKNVTSTKVNKAKPEPKKVKASESKPQAKKVKASEAKPEPKRVKAPESKPQAKKVKASGSKPSKSPESPKSIMKEKVENILLDDESVIQSVELEGEATMAKSPKIRAYQLINGAKWEEIGPGSVKLTVNKELVEEKKANSRKRKIVKSSESQGRLIFHDARNRNVRLNIALGASFSIGQQAQNENPKVLIFSAMSEKVLDGEGKVLQETFLFKESSENPSAESLEKFKCALSEWNSKLSK
ncbi:integrase catalytic protein [Perkinsela sp. CCAP 1560/4]|nr:integrase catalytic protein [Perkinsela sp. CCAP 1560/4]|eukprot:KNH05187.1 integrase catalytic protein [Perkinsela sp. CCAP 1560/4]